MNIYEKLQTIRLELLKAQPKKSGRNKFAGFNYYELGDFVPLLVELGVKYKVFTLTTFNNENASIKAINTEKPDEFVEVTIPMRELELKGANDLQELGGVVTYQRRYLLMTLFDIVDSDYFDATLGKTKAMTKKAEEPKAKETPLSPRQQTRANISSIIEDFKIENQVNSWLIKEYKTDDLDLFTDEQLTDVYRKLYKRYAPLLNPKEKPTPKPITKLL